MRVESMKHFLVVADYQSVSKAARITSIPQQSISSMISALENELGVSLFERENKKMVLTEEGQLFYSYCNQFFKEFRSLQQRLLPVKQTVGRTQFIIATQNNIAQTIIPTWLSAVLKATPELNVDVRIQSALDIVSQIVTEKADVGFILQFKKDDVVWPKLPEDVVFHQLFESKPFIWVNKLNPISNFKSVQLKMLQSGPVIQDQSSDQSLFHYIFDEHFHLNLQIINAANPKIMAHLVKENIAVCPDLKMLDGELALSADFGNEKNVVALPISAKDDYRLVTGYIVKRTLAIDENMKAIFDLLI